MTDDLLPNLERAVISQRKVVAYLLSESIRTVEARLGSSRGTVSRFPNGRFLATPSDATQRRIPWSKPWRRRTGYGTLSKEFFARPTGGRPGYRAVWFVERDGDAPQLVTAYPSKGGSRMIRELDRVVLTKRLEAALNLETGDIATVVLVHEDGSGFEVEFVTLDGETYAVTTVMADDVRPIHRNEIAHAGVVAA